MALYKNAKPKGDIEDSGFFKSFDPLVATILRKAHATVIKSGNDLEGFIQSEAPCTVYKTQYRYHHKTKGTPIKNPKPIEGTTPTHEDVIEKYQEGEDCFFPKLSISRDVFIEHDIPIDEINKVMGKKKNLQVDGIWIKNSRIIINEYKLGYNLDTKKSTAEIQSLLLVKKLFKYFNSDTRIVSWNLKNIDDNSIKDSEAKKHLMTGREFCKQVDVDFDKIESLFVEDQKENTRDFELDVINLLVDKYPDMTLPEMRETLETDYETNN